MSEYGTGKDIKNFFGFMIQALFWVALAAGIITIAKYLFIGIL